MTHDISLGMSFAEVFNNKSGVYFICSIERVKNVVIQHHIFKISETSDSLFLPESIYHSLILGQHVIEHHLLTQDIDDLIIIDALSTVY